MNKRVLVVGDIMFDHYTFVETSRKAAEADIPVWDEVRNEFRLGGAANVALNIKAMGKSDVNVFLAGLSIREGFNGPSGRLIESNGIGTILVGGARTMCKHRYVVDDKVIFRSDNFKHWSDEEITEYERFFCDFIDRGIEKVDVVIISDYNKGTVTKRIVDKVMSFGVPVIVDSKRFDLSVFRGANILKINESEYGNQIVGHDYVNVESLFDNVVVTRGAKSTQLRIHDVVKSSGNRYVVHVEEFAVDSAKSVDVTGCGDTHTAAMAFSILHDPDVRRAVKFANSCASIVVQKFGTSTI